MLPQLCLNDYGILLFAYLIGSVPFGWVLLQFSGHGDIRAQGSGNIGATNAYRVGGKMVGIFTLLLDAGKGVLVVILAKLMADREVAALAAAFVVLGHVFPVYLKFKGGKGVATTLAVLAALYWPLGLVTAIAWISVFLVTRISSLSSLFAMIIAPTFALFFSDKAGYSLLYVTMFLSMLVVIRHHANIKRLIMGEEKKL
ncbi:MAG: glycerol-3-phosphate 1-O-acyltransferase [Proteobacteria bacterium]|nr:glycerol-3-phosphate 1-O-acyltransferase [Pseudomonadota bacterium]